MNRIAVIKSVYVPHRVRKNGRKIDDNLAISAAVARMSGRKPASAYHRMTNGNEKMRTCAGECVNRICQTCKVECSECQKDVCAHCAYTDDVLAMMCDSWHPHVSSALCLMCVEAFVPADRRSEWKPQRDMPECCFLASQQHMALCSMQRNPVARKLEFNEF